MLVVYCTNVTENAEGKSLNCEWMMDIFSVMPPGFILNQYGCTIEYIG